MPRILRIINRFNLGGPTFNAAYLTKFLAPEFETKLIGGSKEPGEDSSEFIVEDLDLSPIILPEITRSIHPIKDYKAYRQIRALIREFKPDIVHTHASKAGALGRLAAYHENVPFIYHTFHGHVFHSYFGSLKTHIYKLIERKLATISTNIIAISAKQKLELSSEHNICQPEHIKVINLGFDLSRFRYNQEQLRATFRAKYEVEDDEIAITIVGRLAPIKNHSLFLKLMDGLKRKSTKKVRAFIVGGGDQEIQIKQMAEDFNLLNTDSEGKVKVVFTSWIRNVELVYAGCDIVVLTSLNEGTPVSLIEAQAAGKPIVSTRVGGIEDIVDAGNTALIRDLSDETGLLSDLLELVENDKKRSQFGQKGWLYVEKRFHYTTLAKNMRDLYVGNMKLEEKY